MKDLVCKEDSLGTAERGEPVHYHEERDPSQVGVGRVSQSARPGLAKKRDSPNDWREREEDIGRGGGKKIDTGFKHSFRRVKKGLKKMTGENRAAWVDIETFHKAEGDFFEQE